MIKIVVKSVLLALGISLVVVRPALAYIDPNAGGLLLQVLATASALFAGVALIFWRQIRMAFARARRFLRGLLNRGDVRVPGTPGNPRGVDTQIEAD